MLYRWPQGRIIRTICMVAAVAMALDLGLTTGLGQWSAWSDQGEWVYLVYAIFVTLLALAMLVAGIVLVGFHARAAQFLIEVEKEMVKVTWPKTNDVTRFTVIIAIMTVVLSLGIFLVDMINKWWVYDLLFETFGGRA